MKIEEKIYFPFRLGKDGKTKHYCLDSKGHPRMYKSMETLEMYMNETYG